MIQRVAAAAAVLAMTAVQTAPALAQMTPMGPGPAEMPAPETRPAPPYTPPPPPPVAPPQQNRPQVGQGAGWNGGNTGTPVGQGAGWNGGNTGTPVGQGAGWNGGNNGRPGNGYPGGGGYPGNGYPGGGYPGGGYQGGGRHHVRCESWNYAYAQCPMDTRGGVEFVQIIKGDCRPGNWGWRPGFVWVNNGCRADFRTMRGGGGGYYPPDRDDGPSAGAVIGGVAIAAGLIALLAKNSEKKAPPAPATAGPPARITADANAVPPAARAAFDICLREASREIGATGGNEIRLERLDQIEKGNGGYRFRMTMTGIYSDQSRSIPMFCRATATKLIEANFG